jgi:hypothetical protein
MTQEGAESLAIQALVFIAADAERTRAFLAATGLAPESIRAAAAERDFLCGVLDYLAGDEPLVLAFAAQAAVDPSDLAAARSALGGAEA